MTKLSPLFVALAVVLGVGCGGSTTTPKDAAREAATPDKGTEAAVPDAIADQRSDTAPPDGGLDVGGDTAPDLVADTAPDVSPDGGVDVAVDVAPDLMTDRPPDAATPDVSPDLAPDLAPDVAMPDLGPSPDVAPGGESFQATLRGGEVVPAVVTAAPGTFTLTLAPGGAAFAYRLQQTVVGATAAALRLAGAGEDGDLVVPLRV